MGHYDKFREKKKPELWKEEFSDFMKVVEMGAEKYEANQWLSPAGAKTSHRDMHASMFRHLAASSSGIINDEESGLDHLLHLATRALMLYTRRKKGITHPDDVQRPTTKTGLCAPSAWVMAGETNDRSD